MDQTTFFTTFIIGTTAAGKTKLSLSLENQIEKSYELLSCDSMQLYKDATIMTAKATKQEQAIVKHHGIDLLELQEEGFNRSKWQSLAKELIEQIKNASKLPVIVGGTHYYMETLMFQQQNQLILEQQQPAEEDNRQCYEKLKEIDPIAAEKFHPNDTRRIQNSLLYYQLTGKLPSEMPDFHSTESKLTSNKFLILWPKWKKKEDLLQKVTSRINEMIYEDGGIEEVIKIFQTLNGIEKINKGGVLQSIGYRQFTEVYNYFEKKQQPLDILRNEDEEFKKLLNSAIQTLIKDTIKYTKKQLQWIRNRILANANIEIIQKRLFLFEFDTDFTNQVIMPAQEIFTIFKQINEKNLFDKIDEDEEVYENFFKEKQYLKQFMIPKSKISELIETQQKKQRNNWKKIICQLCNKGINGPFEWKQHENSKYHKTNLKNKEKKEKLEVQTNLEKTKLEQNFIQKEQDIDEKQEQQISQVQQ